MGACGSSKVPAASAPQASSAPSSARFVPQHERALPAGIEAGAREDEGPECPVCLCGLSVATAFALPVCNHEFHALCLASALQVAPQCPMCRRDVEGQVCEDIAVKLMAEQGRGGNKTLAAKLLLDLRERGRTPDTQLAAEEVIEALRAATRKGDTSKITPIAALLGHGGPPPPSTASSRQEPLAGLPTSGQQPPQVRLAAVEALRALVPAFASEWPGRPHVLDILCSVCGTDPDAEVRCAGLKALREVGQRGEEALLTALERVLSDKAPCSEVRLQAADTLQALARWGDIRSMRAALLTLGDEDLVLSSGLTTLKQICGPRGQCAEFSPELFAVVQNNKAPGARAAALELLPLVEEQGSAAGVEVATAALQDDHEEVAAAALATLRRLWSRGSPEATATLIGLVQAPSCSARDARFRCEAFSALAQLGTRGGEAAKAAASQLGDPDLEVRSTAAKALKQLCVRGDEGVVAALLSYCEAQSGHDLEAKQLAIEALGYAASAQGTARETLETLQAGVDEDLKQAAEQALKQLSRCG